MIGGGAIRMHGEMSAGREASGTGESKALEVSNWYRDKDTPPSIMKVRAVCSGRIHVMD